MWSSLWFGLLEVEIGGGHAALWLGLQLVSFPTCIKVVGAEAVVGTQLTYRGFKACNSHMAASVNWRVLVVGVLVTRA